MQPGHIQFRASRPGLLRQSGARLVNEVGEGAYRALRSGRRGRIAAVFERSLYAVLDEDWICVGSKDLGSGPLHVLCEGIVPRWFSPGQEVAVVGSSFLVGDERFAGLQTAQVWAPDEPPHWSLYSLRAGHTAVDDVWCLVHTDEGLAAAGYAPCPAQPSRILAAAEPGLAALARTLAAGLRGHRPESHDAAAIIELIGLGPGLTPSGDDLIGGALVALASLGFADLREQLWGVCRAHLCRTHGISAAHLRSAARGCAAAALHEAIHATMSGRIDLIGSALAAISAIGHSSGRDAFAGALIVFRAVERQLRYDGGMRPVERVAGVRQ